MDLNNIDRMREIDTEGMIDHINDLPDQLATAWDLGQNLELSEWKGITQALIAGMGGSAIGADLTSAYVAPVCKAPIFVLRDYNLPAWVKGEDTLVICSSHSGNTEETLSVFEETTNRGCRVLAISTGGTLAKRANEQGYPLWKFDHDFQPRAAVGFSFGLLLSVFYRLGLIPDPSKELAEAVEAMKSQQKDFLPEIEDALNPAKRLAGQLVGRWVTVWGAELLAPIAQRWKGQMNEIAKTQASFEVLPEGDHNSFQGIYQPESQFGAAMDIFLCSKHNHPRNQLREEFTRKGLMLEGRNTDFYKAKGKSRLANMWTALHFGDYVAFYLAMAYGADPSPVPVLIELKRQMKEA